MKTYELFTGDELKIAEKIQQRRYQLLVHSCIYYHLDQNIISDQKWNGWANELTSLQKQYPDISRKVVLYDYFKDWDGSTGTFLPITLDWVVGIANRLLQLQNESQQEEKKNIVKKRLF